MKKILDIYFGPREYSVELKNFNMVHASFTLYMFFMTFIISFFITNPIYTYISLAMSFMFLILLIDANRTGRKKLCSIVTSITVNLFFLPVCFLAYGKLYCCVPVYYIIGLLYTVLLIDGNLGVIISLIETVILAITSCVIVKYIPEAVYGQENMMDYLSLVVGLFFAGIFCSVTIIYRSIQYNKEQERVENLHLKVIDALNSKDIFLANMSHEIRTPLNAIIGTINLLLDEEMSIQTRENAYNILNSCNALLSITDELMNLSGTEDGNKAVNLQRYDLSDLLFEIINMMSVRLMESDVVLYVDIENDIPKYLFGDVSKLRQVIINILNNAVKYTKRGKIVFKLRKKIKASGMLNLIAVVSDTGIGIKAENLPKIFNEYKRDMEEEKRIIEGTGIGLSLCKDYINEMGGEISVTSEYHVGSSFSFNVLQQVDINDPLISINKFKVNKVLIFENNEDQANNISKILTSFDISYDIADNRTEFENCVLSKKYDFILISSDKYTDNKKYCDEKINNGKIIIISDISQSVQSGPNCTVINRPVYNINLSKVLLDDNPNYSKAVIKKGGFVCPDCKMLVVDDNLTNLEVAGGILKRYGSRVYTALSGFECLNLIENEEYDIIFLDYMMPEMNGIDTLYKIRQFNSEHYKTVPVIALTANVINGAKEMFLESGFDDYIAKPIDINKLEKVLKKYIKREKIQIKQ